MIRWTTFRSCEPDAAPERAFLTVGDIVEHRAKPAPHDFTVGHMLFYGPSEDEARGRAERWVIAEQKRLADAEAARLERAAAARKKTGTLILAQRAGGR